MIRLALVLSLIAAPAMAQDWNSTTFGNQTHYYGSDGWSGNSTTFGNQTHSYFTGPNGQSTTCNSTTFGTQTHTYCQ